MHYLLWLHFCVSVFHIAEAYFTNLIDYLFDFYFLDIVVSQKIWLLFYFGNRSEVKTLLLYFMYFMLFLFSTPYEFLLTYIVFSLFLFSVLANVKLIANWHLFLVVTSNSFGVSIYIFEGLNWSIMNRKNDKYFWLCYLC